MYVLIFLQTNAIFIYEKLFKRLTILILHENRRFSDRVNNTEIFQGERIIRI